MQGLNPIPHHYSYECLGALLRIILVKYNFYFKKKIIKLAFKKDKFFCETVVAID